MSEFACSPNIKQEDLFSLNSVSVYNSPLHGNGVIATKPLTVGDIAFNEKPLHHLQSLTNKQDVIACSHCLKFLGTIQTQVNILMRKISRQELCSNPLAYQCLPCQQECGELYCSTACRDQHWCTCHKLLCTGHIKDEEADSHPLVQFKVHSVRSNEIFLMCADIFSQSCLAIENSVIAAGVPSPEVFQQAIVSAIQPYQSFVRQLWWDAAVAPAGTNPKMLIRTLKRLVNESWELLSQSLDLKSRHLDKVLSAETFSRTIGMFEQNNVGIRLKSPAAEFIENLDSNNSDFKDFFVIVEEIVNGLEAEVMDCQEFDEGEDGGDEELDDNEENIGEMEEDEDIGDEEEEDEMAASEFTTKAKSITVHNKENLLDLIDEGGGMDRVFPPLDGAAFYLMICKINHSCDPNVIVKYKMSDVGLLAQVTVLKDIQPGEELVQSYIDQSQPYVTRKKALKDYGFECSCSKCQNKI